MHTMRIPVLALTLSLMLAHESSAARTLECAAKSGLTRVAMLELYTSEGCDSCPPADRWLSALPTQELGFDKLVPIALHVDYWNYLGWVDRFANAQFTQRQRTVSARNRSSEIYTPQRVLNGRDYRPPMTHDDTALRVAEINRAAPGAEISLRITGAIPKFTIDLHVRATARADSVDADTYLAVIENGLESAVARGENRGKRLKHDFVVRTLLGPFPLGSSGAQELTKTLELAADVKPDRSVVIAFTENRRTGDVLQALALPMCES